MISRIKRVWTSIAMVLLAIGIFSDCLAAPSFAQQGAKQGARKPKDEPTRVPAAADTDQEREEDQPKKSNDDKQALAKKVKELSDQLDSDRRVERDTAEATLLQMNWRILEFLPSTSPDASPEWQMRIDRVREVLEKQQSDELSQPSTVTLAGNMTGREALMKISELTKNPITLPPEENTELQRTIAVEFSQTPFWEALDEILDELEMTIDARDGAAIDLLPRSPNTPLRSAAGAYSGAFRIEAVSVDKSMNLQRPERNHAVVELVVAWEPRLSPALIRIPTDNMELVCDNSESLSAVTKKLEMVPVGGAQLTLPVELQLPAREATKIYRWKGKLQVTIPGQMATVEFSDLMKSTNSKASMGSLTVTMEKTRKNRDLKEILIGISLKDAQQTIDSFRGWAANNEAYLLDADGKRIDHVGWSTTRMNKESAGLSFLFEADGDLDGYKFVYRAPGAVIAQESDFTLEDIPLP